MIGIAVRIVICIVCMRESFAWNPHGHIFARQKKFNATLLRNKQIVLNAYEPDDSNTVLEDGTNQVSDILISESIKEWHAVMYV